MNCEAINLFTYTVSYLFFYLCIGVFLAGVTFDAKNTNNYIKCVGLIFAWPLTGLFILGLKVRKEFYVTTMRYW